MTAAHPPTHKAEFPPPHRAWSAPSSSHPTTPPTPPPAAPPAPAQKSAARSPASAPQGANRSSSLTESVRRCSSLLFLAHLRVPCPCTHGHVPATSQRVKLRPMSD